jgi:glycosyltransferase involved in cell wall biosynthesis
VSNPEIALLISSYQRPQHLARCLLSVAHQRGVDGRFEVVVTDDGSEDETPATVERFAARVDFTVRFTTHPHVDFQLARCRNEGVAASRAAYLLFLDGDCILPPDHVRIQLARRKRGTVLAGDCAWLDRTTSERVTEDCIRSAAFLKLTPRAERARIRKAYRKAWFYSLIRHPTKPKMFGGNVAIWREDYERVNGYDENFRGWGCEDDDLRIRLRAAGVRIESIARWTHTFHLWHPPGATSPSRWKEGRNVAYLMRRERPTWCANGLRKESVAA